MKKTSEARKTPLAYISANSDRTKNTGSYPNQEPFTRYPLLELIFNIL